MSRGALGLAALIAVVAAAVVAGLVVSGSPAEQRRLRADDQRAGDLQRIASTIERYHRETGRLPEDLEMLVNGWTSDGIPRDPATEEAYGYEVIGSRTYRLCADFARASRPGTDVFWAHEAGRQCFSLDFSTLRQR